MWSFPAELQKAKSKAQNSSNLREEANICNQLGELLSRNGKSVVINILNHYLCSAEQRIVKGAPLEKNMKHAYVVLYKQ